MRRRWTARRKACRRTAISTASKSSWSAAAGLTRWLISSSSERLPRHSFFSFGGGRGGLRRQANVAELLVDCEQVAGEAAEALVLVELGLDAGRGGLGQGAGSAFAVDVADEHEIGPVAGLAALVTATSGCAALHVAVDKRAAAHVTDGLEFGKDAVAPLFEGGQIEVNRHGAFVL